MHLESFQILPIKKNAITYIFVPSSWCTGASFFYTQDWKCQVRGYVNVQCNNIFQNVFKSSCAHLCAYKYCKKDPIASLILQFESGQNGTLVWLCRGVSCLLRGCQSSMAALGCPGGFPEGRGRAGRTAGVCLHLGWARPVSAAFLGQNHGL